MIAVDTNVVVRLLTQDDPAQFGSASAVFAAGDIWIAKTVLLETAWVLNSVYRFSPDAVRTALILLVGLPNVHVEDPRAIVRALGFSGHGLELADAIHVESRPKGARFVTFDAEFVRRGRRAGVKDLTEVSIR